MAWQYDAVRDELTVTYGSQDREVDQSFATEDSVLEVDRHGDPLRVVVRRASRISTVDQLLSLGSASTDGERLYTIAEVADKLGVKAYSVRQEVLSAGMPALKTATSWDVRACVADLYREVLAVRHRLTVVSRERQAGRTEGSSHPKEVT